jgi:peptidoglycan/LPS O-acetylase OafA/YrhL
LLVLISFSLDQSSHHLNYLGWIVVEIATAILIIDAVSLAGLLKQVLETKWLVWIGSISYDLYLWHPVIFKIMHLGHFEVPMVLLLGGGLTFAIASLSFYFVERPILRMKHSPQKAA